MIHFSHVRDTENAGDLTSCPALYFDFPEHGIGNYSDPVPPCDTIIFGGGALTGWAMHTAEEIETRILWGTGSTRHGETAPWPDPDGFALVGVREWSAEREEAGRYVPCASCMSPLFDRDYQIEHEAVRFMNADASIKMRYPMGGGDLPTMENTASFEDIIGFLGSAETVVTNSYHGVYWAALLGRKVVCVPYSSKFYGHKFVTADSYSGGGDWRKLSKLLVFPTGVLEDSRAASRRFYERVMELVAI